MRIIETDRHRKPSREDLRLLLAACQEEARDDDHFKIVSISLQAPHMDPLAVLDSIFELSERHFYLENQQEGIAIAGADAVVLGEFSGPDRFAQAKRWSDEMLEHTVTLGDLDHSFSGPHFFAGFTFADLPADEVGAPFAAATLMLPRWQVARSGWSSVAVANLRVDADADIDALANRVWSAYQKFSSFDYSAPVVGKCNRILSHFDPESVGSYQNRVRTALSQIADGRYHKIVLARTMQLEFTDVFQPLQILNRLRNLYNSCFCFSFSNGRGDSFFGASPERLVRLITGKLETVAIAGSEPRGKSMQEDARLARDLLTSEKDMREHQLVVDSLLKRLAEVGAENKLTGTPELLQLSNVQHLLTRIEAQLPPDRHLLDAVAVLHPTPAVGGSPREAACSDISRLEPFDRGLYAGLVGWFNHRGDGDFVVGLRSALGSGPKVRMFAGAGIVRGSDPEKEFRETEVKMLALKEALEQSARPITTAGFPEVDYVHRQ